MESSESSLNVIKKLFSESSSSNKTTPTSTSTYTDLSKSPSPIQFIPDSPEPSDLHTDITDFFSKMKIESPTIKKPTPIRGKKRTISEVSSEVPSELSNIGKSNSAFKPPPRSFSHPPVKKQKTDGNRKSNKRSKRKSKKRSNKKSKKRSKKRSKRKSKKKY